MQNQLNTTHGNSLRIDNAPVGTWMFFRLAAQFTHKFTSAATTPMAQALIESEWALGLRGLTADQIRHGVDRTRTKIDGWPPSIGEFINLALDIPPIGEFMAENDPNSQLLTTACMVGKLSTWDLNQMSIEDLRFWKRDMYPLVVEALRKERML